MRIRKTFDSALARLTGERAASLSPDDPAFQALSLNLSHILQQSAASQPVRQAAAAAWRNLGRECTPPPGMIWPAAAMAQIQQQPALIVIPPAGCSFCPSCLGDGITGYLLSPDRTSQETIFFGSPAQIWLSPIADAVTSRRSIWFGWLAETPAGPRGELVEIYRPTDPRSPQAVTASVLRQTETVLRAFPNQCVADRPFWATSYQPA